MAEMGLGYGSEYQLLRFLGHHRNDFFEKIKKAIGTDCEIEWRDYPMDSKRNSLDGELKGIEFFKSLPNYAQIKKEWSKFWANSGNTLNWDGIFKCGDEWFFVEAKAHENEFNNEKDICGAKVIRSDGKPNKGRIKIENALKDTANWLGAEHNNWIEGNFYQLKNRLAFINFCNNRIGIKAKLLYVNFIDGYKGKSIKDKESWDRIWDEAFLTLGLSNEISQERLKGILYRVYPNCLP